MSIIHIENAADLKASIAELERRKVQQERLLKEHGQLIYESLKPVNLIKSTVSQLSQSQGFKRNMLNAGLGIGAGLLTKKVLAGASKNMFRRIMVAAIEMGIAALVSKNTDKLSGARKGILGFLGGNKAKQPQPAQTQI